VTHCDNVLDLSKHPRWQILFQDRVSARRTRKSTAIDGDDLQVAVAACIRRFAAANGGIDAVAELVGVEPRTVRGWQVEGAYLPRAEYLLRVARLHPPLADLLAQEMGIRVDGLTAQEIAALRALLPAARVVERLVEPDQADLFAG
jgi:hypothetical protein